MLNVEVQADGTLTGNLIAGRLGSPATHTPNTLYMPESGTNASNPLPPVMLSKWSFVKERAAALGARLPQQTHLTISDC